MTNDQAKAVALQIAYEKLKSNGFRFDVSDIGYNAALIIQAMESKLAKSS